MPTAMCIPNEGGLTLACGNVLQHFSLKVFLDVTLWQKMSTKPN